MKNMKKLVSLLLTLVMVFAMTATAFAAGETYNITINNGSAGHTYEAYQIFTGELSKNDNKLVLSNIQWGDGVSDAGQKALGVAETLAATLEDEADAKVFAKEVVSYLATVKGSTSTMSDGKYVISGLPAGYYLVKDKDGSLANKNDAYTEYIVKVVENVETAPKSDVSTVVKKVKDINDSTETKLTDWQDSADHDINDTVYFKLEATLADNVSSYKSYKVIFHDTLSAGLTYKGDAVYYIDGTEVANNAFTPSINGTELTFTCNDVKALGATNESTVTVVYTATLNEDAVIGSQGNPNTVYLEYSNNPNWNGEGTEDTGKTEEDKVIVFTYKVVVNKVDEDEHALTGAEFKLQKEVKNEEGPSTWIDIAAAKNDAGDIFTFTGLDDGNYKLVETKTPEGYNSIDPIEFTVTAEHEILSDNPALESLTGEKVTGEITFTSNTTAGSLSTSVVNQSGATLPETGGMGTTIFYVLGAILVIGAGVVLVARKRMDEK